MAIDRSARSWNTVVAADASLLAALGSGVSAETWALSVIVDPSATNGLAVTVTTNVADPPGASAPARVQAMSPADEAQDQGPLTPARVVLGGIESLRTGFTASDGPKLETVIV